MADEQKPKRKYKRSPGYPLFGLGEAVSKAQIIYQHEKRNPTTPQVLMAHMGYGKKSGSGLRALAALKQYGLLEEHDGAYRIADLASRIIDSREGSPEKLEALREAAQKPHIFRELLVTYGAGLPSDATIESFLISKKEFNPTSVADFIRVFKGTIELAKLTPGKYATGKGDETLSQKQERRPSQDGDRMQSLPATEELRFSWPLSILRNTALEVRLFGRDFREEDLKRLDAHFEVLKANLQELIEAAKRPAGGETQGE